MYECLTGHVPFMGSNYANTMGKQISEMPTPFAKMRPDLPIPQSLEIIVMKALAKNADDRYQSLTQMRKELEVALSAQPHQATSISPKRNRSHSKLPSMGQDSNPRASGSKIKVAGDNIRRDADNTVTKLDNKSRSRSQSPNSISSPPPADVERPKKKSTVRSGLDLAIIDPQRIRSLILIAAGSLIVTFTVIAVFTHGELVAAFVAATIKQVVEGTDDDQRSAKPTGSQGSSSQTDREGLDKDPQESLRDWITPGRDNSQTESSVEGTSENSSASDAVDSAKSDSQLKAVEADKQQEQERQEQERQQQN
jgi:hypothetical protein